MYNFCSSIDAPAKKMAHRFAADEREDKNTSRPKIFFQFGINLSLSLSLSLFLLPHLRLNEYHVIFAQSLSLFLLPHLALFSNSQIHNSGQIRLYPSPVTNLLLPKHSFTLSQTPGQIARKGTAKENIDDGGNKTVELGISCGLFHSSLIVDGTLWIWGKGDGGRLGLGHENPMFVPTLNHHIDHVRCVALGGLHSVSLTSAGEVFTWSESLNCFDIALV